MFCTIRDRNFMPITIGNVSFSINGILTDLPCWETLPDQKGLRLNTVRQCRATAPVNLSNQYRILCCSSHLHPKLKFRRAAEIQIHWPNRVAAASFRYQNGGALHARMCAELFGDYLLPRPLNVCCFLVGPSQPPFPKELAEQARTAEERDSERNCHGRCLCLAALARYGIRAAGAAPVVAARDVLLARLRGGHIRLHSESWPSICVAQVGGVAPPRPHALYNTGVCSHATHVVAQRPCCAGNPPRNGKSEGRVFDRPDDERGRREARRLADTSVLQGARELVDEVAPA
mmetsp:Transcript_22170/g.59129  ORF Transcript_22170/g.59129 Transcript_22170/m.59129 type:complete len:289 (-) Transcript_22170:408-1274(-)